MTIETMTMKSLYDSYKEAQATFKKAKASLDIIKDEIERRLKPLANDYGTFERCVDNVNFKIVRGKNISWDNKALEDLYFRIESDNADASLYIKRKVEYSVSENAYKEWPDELKEIFNVARTEKEPKFSFECLDD